MAQTGSGEEVRLAHGQLVQTLDELLRKTFSDWSRGVDRLSIQRLEQPLMLRCRQENTMLDVNFDKWVALSRGGGGGWGWWWWRWRDGWWRWRWRDRYPSRPWRLADTQAHKCKILDV